MKKLWKILPILLIILSSCNPVDCTNGIQDGDETGIDCGGSCPNCVTSSNQTSANTITFKVIGGLSGETYDMAIRIDNGYEEQDRPIVERVYVSVEDETIIYLGENIYGVDFDCMVGLKPDNQTVYYGYTYLNVNTSVEVTVNYGGPIQTFILETNVDNAFTQEVYF